MVERRWILHFEAAILQKVMHVGMFLHTLRFPQPSFSRRIPVTVSLRKGFIDLLFYTPKDYPKRPGALRTRKYPVLVNFHGGGFTVGLAGDDVIWACAVVEGVEAVVVCVEYRLAPRFPFPTAVEDGVDALMYVMRNADKLNLDLEKIGISGFSSGANMALTVPLMLQREKLRMERKGCEGGFSNDGDVGISTGRLAVVISWYPTTDYATYTREERRRSNTQPRTEVPKRFTNLFDAAYIHPASEIALSNPYLSPALAPRDMLEELPNDIIIYTCGWDSLRAEAERFKEYLVNELQKSVRYEMIPAVRHAWDKRPNPFKRDAIRDSVYREACIAISEIFARV